MRIAIVGGGAIGLLYTYYLNQHHEVVLYVRNPSQRDKIQSDGISLQNKDGTHETKVKVKSVSEWCQGTEDLSIICVKQYHVQALLEKANIKTNHPVLFLQNGMGHLKWIDRLGACLALVGSVEHGAFRMNERSVVHTGEGLTRMAFYKGHNEEFINSFMNPLQMTFPFQFEADYKEMLQKKLVVNAIINPLTALLKVPNGALLDNPYFFQIFQDLFVEIKGILMLDKEELYYDNLIQVCKNTSQNRSSMLKDLEEGRQTEIDAIIGYLLEEAHKKNRQAPLINSLYHFIKGSELREGGK